MAVSNMYQRLNKGEQIPVTVPDSGRDFSIRPEYWGRVVLGYSVVGENGRAVRGAKGIMLEREEVEAWADELEERVWCDHPDCQGFSLPHEHE